MKQTSHVTISHEEYECPCQLISTVRQARIQEKNKPPQNFPVSQFNPMLINFLQRFPDFSLTKFFKVRKYERCGSLNPRLKSIDKVKRKSIEVNKIQKII